MLLFMSFMYSRKRTGPRTEPCRGRPGGGGGGKGAVAPPEKSNFLNNYMENTK